MKTKGLKDTEFLTLLQRVLSNAMPDPHLASRIYDEVTKEIRLVNSLQSFEKFCEKEGLPNLEPQTVTELQTQLASNFGQENVSVTPDEEGKSLAVEISLPDRTVTTKVDVRPPGEDDGEAKAPMVPFPVSLPEDPELIWMLARRENLGPDEAARALAKIEEEFWATKAGQKALKEGTDRTFAEFIALVPAAALADSGMKRHYKEPEPLNTLRLLKGGDALIDRIAAA
ncbi:hypothetical protein ACXR0O_24020 [Verrucomicrobiota bacterium sgz303538]